MSDIFIAGYSLQSCLGNSITEAICTMKSGKIKPLCVELPEGQRKPYYLIHTDNASQIPSSSDNTWPATSAESVKRVCADCIADTSTTLNPQMFLASSSLDMGGIKQASQLGAPLFNFGNQLARELNWPTKPISVNTACTSAFNALSLAVRQIKAEHTSDALILGIEIFNPYTLFGFEAMQLLAPDFAQPLGHERQGLVLGEAISALHISNKHNTLSTKQQTRAWQILACANVVDGRNPTGATEAALVQACQQALRQAQLNSSDIDLIKLQAAGSPTNDSVEIDALRQVFEVLPPCASLKMAIGHTLGASGAAETALLLACIENEVWPKIDYAMDASMGLYLVSHERPIASEKIRTIMLITLGFGGGHSALILRRYAP